MLTGGCIPRGAHGIDHGTERRRRRQSAEPKLADSIWQRIQRSSLYTRIMPPIDMSEGFDTFIAFCPILRRPSNFGTTTVRLDAVKQGTFHGSPATFIRLEVLHSEEYKIHQTDFKIDLYPSHAACPKSPAHIAAFGPGRVTRPQEAIVYNPPPPGTFAGVEIRQQDDGIMMEILDRTRPRGYPISIQVGLVIVHSAIAQLTIVPTTGKLGRAGVFRKTRVYPLDVDLSTAFNDVTTCGLDHGTPCSDTCADFGPQHMTAAVWSAVLGDNRIWEYSGDGPDNSWVRYAEPQ